ncbi:hypothetical protein D3C84_1209250 [compost metagenome]
MITLEPAEQAHDCRVVSRLEIWLLHQQRSQCFTIEGVGANQLLEPFALTDVDVQGDSLAVGQCL